MKNLARYYCLIAWPLLACEDPLKPAQRIDEPRVLGVRVSNAAGDATLRGGEVATVELLLAGPDGAFEASVAYRICEAADSQRGVPFCIRPPFAEGTSLVASAAIPFEVPEDLTAGQRLALVGVACLEGEPLLAATPVDFACSSGSAPLRFSFDVWALDAEPNQNPSLADLTVTLEGDTLDLATSDDVESCDSAAPSVPTAQRQRLRLELGDDAREAGEALQISHFATRGQLERQYSFVDGDDAPQIELGWTTPREAGPVTQYVVVRDGRGGESWATFHVCVR